jgi:addiction module RelB/DinJ family antitoxin
MVTSKTRTNVYLDENLKYQAKELFKQYGLSFSNGLNFLLKQLINKNEMPLPKDIELVLPKDDDYKLVKNIKDEETISLDEFLKL